MTRPSRNPAGRPRAFKDPVTAEITMERRHLAAIDTRRRGRPRGVAIGEIVDLVAEAGNRDHLPAVAPKEPVGIGPWTRVGGPMPEPWPGCGVEHFGVKLLVTRVAPGHGAVEWEMDSDRRLDITSPSVTSLWDGRVCVWRRDA